jgi:hypothetical protein
MNLLTKKKREERRYNVPVIGYLDKGKVRFESILQAEAETGINYNLIFESAIGKIFCLTHWEFENKEDEILYKSKYILPGKKTRLPGING